MAREMSSYEKLARPMMEALAADDPDRASGLNSVGFSGADTRVGHDLVDQGYPWTPVQCELVHKILRRYKNTQLPRLGFDYDVLPDPDADGSVTEYKAAKARRQQHGASNGQQTYQAPKPKAKAEAPQVAPATVTVDGNRVIIGWGWDRSAFYDRLSAVKAVPGSRFDGKTKQWTIEIGPQSGESLLAMADTLERLGNTTGLDDLRAAVDASVERFAQTLEASRAMAADLEVRGIQGQERLRPFQRAGVAYASEHRHTIIADDMGLGKTLEALATTVHNGCQRVLIVSPASLKLNWKREIGMWVGEDATYHVVSGKAAGQLPVVRFTVVNYDILTNWADTLAAVPWDAIVADECHYLKNYKANRSKAFAQIVKNSKPDYLLMLTGTPMLNRPVELFPILKMIGKDKLVGGWKQYTERYCNAHHNGWGLDVSGASNLDELNTVLRSGGMMIRRRKTDVMKELPPRQWAPVPVRIDTKFAKTYDQMVEHAMNSQEPGAVLQLIGELRKLMAQAKLAGTRVWIDQFLESTDEKLVVMAWHRQVTVDLAKHYDAPMIIGGMNQQRVEEGKQRFQNDPECRVIVCNIAAGGVGHTLTAASNVVFVESAWNGALMDQALDRVHRMGQTADSVTGWLLTGARDDGKETIDDYMAEMVASKREITTEGTDGTGTSSQRRLIAQWARQLADRDEAMAMGDVAGL